MAPACSSLAVGQVCPIRTGDWLGAPTFFSSFPPETNTRLVREAGFEILRDELVTFREPDGDVTFQWVLAMRRRRRTPMLDAVISSC